MENRIDFGIEYLYSVTTLAISEKGAVDFDPVVYAAARFFLLDWGLSIDEADEANRQLLNFMKDKSLEPTEKLDRLFNRIKSDPVLKEKYATQIAALVSFDNKITDMEKIFMNVIQDKLDFRHSEIVDIFTKGINLSIGLRFFGENYAKNKKK